MPAPAAVPSAAPSTDSAPRGRKRALCVGIDTYPSAPLGGCVNDATLWQQTLQALGFEVQTLFNEQAEREPLAAAIEQLFTSAADGDEIVLQFAGHGTQAPDVDGDEASGDTPGLDEALCPHDFDAGPLLLDDDLGALIDRIAPGVRLTLFMDCCHSGNNSRAAPVAGARPRSVRLTAAQKQAFLDWRAQQRPAQRSRSARPAVKRSASDPVEINFSACLSRELAWESNGHGEFTLHATRALRDGGAALAPDALYRRIVDAFGAARRQTPQMEAPPQRLGTRLFR
jgi:Caspase domain